LIVEVEVEVKLTAAVTESQVFADSLEEQLVVAAAVAEFGATEVSVWVRQHIQGRN
jgi:hypothetical protein